MFLPKNELVFIELYEIFDIFHFNTDDWILQAEHLNFVLMISVPHPMFHGKFIYSQTSHCFPVDLVTDFVLTITLNEGVCGTFSMEVKIHISVRECNIILFCKELMYMKL